jgi:signal transduction histidine kinase
VVWGALVLVTLATVAREDADNVAITAAIFALPVFAGRAWGERDRERRAAQQEADVLQGRIDEQVADALARERLRIARELHDVTSHAVGVMVLQAGAAATLRTSRPTDAREALAVVTRSAEEALAELTVMRDVLRAGALGPAADYVHLDLDLKPALADLVARMRTAGLDVTARCEAEGLGPSLRTTVYRVAQEALTNAAKHAPGSRVVLDVRREGSHVVVEVHDDGNVEGIDGQPGFGLVGLAERVRAQGGELGAGAVPGGGFAVRARMPVAGGVPEVTA